MPDDPVFDVRMDAGVVRMAWAEGTHITEGLARDALALVHEVAAGRPHAVLVDISGIVTMNRDARKIFAEEGSAARIAVLGRSVVSRVVANFALGVIRQPTRHFTSEAAAITWLLGTDDSRSSPES